MSALCIAGGRVLLESGLQDADVWITGGRLALDGPADARVLDATGLLVLPGIVDIHGDAFERQVQPRPGIAFPTDIALADTEAQLLANGITTAFHGVTLSWEPGLRDIASWRAWLAALDAHRPRAVCDMRVHLRWEAYNLDALDQARADILAGRVHLLAFNDHTPSIMRKLDDRVALAKFSARGPVTVEAFADLARQVWARGEEVPAALDTLAGAAREAGLPIASHDDPSPEAREQFRHRGARICEFPLDEAVARSAREHGDWVVMGSPNVVRGGSHLGWASAAEMAERGLCTVLSSDYFYPALLHAPFILERRGVLDLAEAWRLVSTNAAAAGGLHDRGVVADGKRADLVLVDPGGPRPVATIAAGRVAWCGAEGLERGRG